MGWVVGGRVSGCVSLGAGVCGSGSVMCSGCGCDGLCSGFGCIGVVFVYSGVWASVRVCVAVGER